MLICAPGVDTGNAPVADPPNTPIEGRRTAPESDKDLIPLEYALDLYLLFVAIVIAKFRKSLHNAHQ